MIAVKNANVILVALVHYFLGNLFKSISETSLLKLFKASYLLNNLKRVL